MKVPSIFKHEALVFFSSVTPVYVITLLLVFACVAPYLPQPSVHAQYPAFAYEKRKISPTQSKEILSGNPVEIKIPKLNLIKSVEPGIYNPASGTWNISDLGVHFATISSPINDNSGNSFFYAHNNQWAFGRLYLLRPGDTVEVRTDNNLLFRYNFYHSQDYDPEDTSVFAYQGPPIITLQTCSGLFNEYRHLYTFSFIGVEKI